MAKKKRSKKILVEKVIAPTDKLAEFGVDTAKGGVIFTAASIIRAIGTLLLLIILARLLQPADYGLYTIVVAFAALFGLNTDYGVGNALRKKLPESKTKDRILSIINNAYFGALCVAIIITIAGLIFSGYIATNLYKNSTLTVPIMIAFVSIIFSTLFAVTISTLLGLRKNKEAGIGYIVYSISQLILSSALVFLGYGIEGALIGMLLSFILGFLASLGYLLKYIEYKFIRPTKKLLVELFSFSTPIFASNAVSMGTMNLGVVLLGVFASSFIVGNYGAAFKLGSFGNVIIIALGSILLPTYSYMISNRNLSSKLESVYNNSIYYSLLILAPLLAYFVSISKPLVYLLLSNTYTLAPFYFAIISIGIIAGIINRYGGAMVIGYGKVKIYTLYQIAASIIMIILLFLLTPYIKVYGVLISLFIIGPIILDLVFVKFMEKELHIKLNFSKPIKIILSTVILWLILTYVAIMITQARYIIFINCVITIIVYPALLALLKGIVLEDVKFIENISIRLHIDFIVKYLLDYTKIFIRNNG